MRDHSKGAIRRAGRILRQTHSEPSEELLEAFRVAHSWRTSHLEPMRSMRASIAGLSRTIAPASVSAARLKRMKSIRAKLSLNRNSLLDIQDLGGCRAILPDVQSCRALADKILDKQAHEFVRRTNYIRAPRSSGYRSDHLIYRYFDDERSTGRLIEIQLRTRLQHAWATALEAVGLVRNENLKGGQGDADWLRLFELTSAEIAEREKQPLPESDAATAAERRKELQDLNGRLEAVSTLDSYRRAIESATAIQADRGGMFAIQYDRSAQTVAVRRSGLRPSAEYERMEAQGPAYETVLVEVDSAHDLAEAYPNYFLDVADFLQLLKSALGRKDYRGWKPNFSQLLTWRDRGQ